LAVAFEHRQAGRLSEAEGICQKVHRAQPHNADALYLLGLIAHDRGDYALAAELTRKAIALNGSVAVYHYCLGMILTARGEFEQAVASYERAIALRPDHAEAHNDLGDALSRLGRKQEALVHFQRALSINPQLAEVHNNLGLVLKSLGRLDEAVPCFQQYLALRPSALAHFQLGLVYLQQERWDLAKECLLQVIALEPDSAAAFHNLGSIDNSTGNPDEAVACFERALALDPGLAEAFVGLAQACSVKGQLEQAIRYTRQALSLRPDHAAAHSNLLYYLSHDGRVAPETLFVEHRRWAELHGRVPALFPAHTNDPLPDRRLRIGYVSPDFRSHAVAAFFVPILTQHDPTQVETYCYAEVAVPDQTTAHLQTLANAWQFTCGMTDEDLARKIYADRIDILVDLAGHTANNRLRAFAYKPAPVQATWIGYPQTTGLKQIDYRLTDVVMDPPHKPTLGTEELIWLRGGGRCFWPEAAAPAVNPLPALRRGYVTFGSLHKLDKLTPDVLDLWCRILHAVPSARLLVFRDTLRGPIQRRLEQEFVQRGIAASRLDLRHACDSGFYSVYHEIDVSLDAFPWGGGTTSCQSLYMGVPLVTLAGTMFSSRSGAYLLTRVGLTDWIARSPDEYVTVAQRHAGDLDRLANVRSTLRGRMAATVCDAQGVTRGLEEAYREMWRRWCERVRFAGPAGVV
jgi:predicted O-linked N-acetylglucosamine transferase (SPINDLY family)